jgi:hypothetical protein
MGLTTQQKFQAEYAEVVGHVSTMIRHHKQLHEGYAFTAGYLESLCVSMLMELPKTKRSAYVAQIQQQTRRTWNEIVDKELETLYNTDTLTQKETV